MEITTAKEQSFISEYIAQDELVNYDYPVNQNSFNARVNISAHAHSAELAQVIKNYMSDLLLEDCQLKNIEALADGAQVVIGGQQAGLFVSPLYTIHKIISIIVLAREQSKQLGKDIVPVFWIAGEDHDFSEVNHLFVYDDEMKKMIKVKAETKQNVEDSVSTFTMTEEERLKTVDHFISQLHETEMTNDIKALLYSLPNHWTEQFKVIIQSLFAQHGLLIIDSHDQGFRQLERDAFKWMLTNHQAIDEAFIASQQLGDTPQIQTATNVHLFMSYEGQRQLLMFDNGKFTLNKSDVIFEQDELLRLIDAQPELFSNNVVTRPLMQELMFNTLAFIGGPSEIKYWAELKKIFELAGRTMPVIVPRMRITYLTDRIVKLLNKHQLDAVQIITEGIEQSKYNVLQKEENKPYIAEIGSLKEIVQTSFNQLMKLAESDDVREMTEKNYKHQLKQIAYLENHYERELKRANQVTLSQLEEIHVNLHPRSGLQERTWHPLQILNATNMSLFNDVIENIDYNFDLILIKI